MNSQAIAARGEASFPEMATLRRLIRPFESAVPARALRQMATSFPPFLALWAAMYASLDISYWLTLALAFPAAGFVVRIFIIQHDCGHGSFFRSRRANTIVGRMCIPFTVTPFQSWRVQHAAHHRTSNNLDQRTGGPDIFAETHTTEEYWRLSRMERLFYRFSRHPLVCHILVPPFVFLVLYRTPFDTPRECTRERRSVQLTNLALLATFGALGYGLGFKAVALVHLPIMSIAAVAGIWLFAVQHRFEGTRWYRQQEWDRVAASLSGTSWLRLPRVLQWFSGNIGLHHLHHISPLIANYRLEECLQAHPVLQNVPTLSLRQALNASRFWLWDEERQQMVGFRECLAHGPGRSG